MVWIIGGLLVVLAASVAGLVFAVQAIHKSHKNFFEFANQCNDYLARSNSDLADKVISHSEKFLELKRIEQETEPATPAPRQPLIRQYEGAEGPAFVPQGDFAQTG